MPNELDTFIANLPPPQIHIPYTLTSNLQYTTHTTPPQLLDLYIPNSTPTSPTSFPLIIYIHGGAFKFGDKVNPLIPLSLLNSHYAIASLNYRLSGTAPFPAAVQDCKAAVRWLRAHSDTYRLAPDRFVVMGESAGAYMAVMVGLTGTTSMAEFESEDTVGVSSGVAGVIDFYGPTDFLQMDEHAPSESTMRHNDADSPESLFVGRHITDPEAVGLLKRTNPITYVETKGVPVLVAHGTGDRIVPFHQSVLLVEALKDKGREVVFHEVEGADHVWLGISDAQRVELDKVVERFLKGVFGS